MTRSLCYMWDGVANVCTLKQSLCQRFDDDTALRSGTSWLVAAADACNVCVPPTRLIGIKQHDSPYELEKKTNDIIAAWNKTQNDETPGKMRSEWKVGFNGGRSGSVASEPPLPQPPPPWAALSNKTWWKTACRTPDNSVLKWSSEVILAQPVSPAQPGPRLDLWQGTNLSEVVEEGGVGVKWRVCCRVLSVVPQSWCVHTHWCTLTTTAYLLATYFQAVFLLFSLS